MKIWVKDGLSGVGVAVILSTTIAIIWYIIHPYILYKTIYQFFLFPGIVVILPIALIHTYSKIVPVVLITLTILISILIYFLAGLILGKIIRKIHLDEVPQMINILKGNMTLVGPRPERPIFVKSLEGVISNYDLRHIITPGFTGWAQIKYRYANSIEDSKEKFEYDLYYVKNRNTFLDLGIILRTIQIVFTH